jgi:pyroglutamyl-peptidase
MILLTGFERFNHYNQNISKLITKNFPDIFLNTKIVKKVLPVSWKKSFEEYIRVLNLLMTRPNLIVMTGGYSGKKILIERFGWNLAFGIDNENQFKIGFIKLGTSLRIKCIINLKRIVSILDNPKKMILSSYPGTFLCNYIYYLALHSARGKYPVIFIHLPSKSNIRNLKKDFYKIVKVIMEYG